MRNLLGGLLIAILIVLLVLLIAAFGAVGVAAIGWLLQRWFDLTQWQGTLTALGVAAGLAFLVYKLVAQPSVPTIWEDDMDEWDDAAAEPEAVEEPPIVPWRRSRPTQGDLPIQKPTTGSGRKRK